MSWRYIPGALAEYLPQNGCLGGKPFAMSNGNNIVSTLPSSESKTACSTTRPSGTMLEHSTGVPGLDAWVLSQRAFRAPHTAQPAKDKAETTNATSGRTPFASLERSSLNGSYWRMSQGSFRTIMSNRFSGSWPKAGMIVDGIAYRLPRLDTTIGVKGYGLLPTPTARDGRGYYVITQRLAKRRLKRPYGPCHWVVFGAVLHGWKRSWANPRFSELMMGFPIGWLNLQPLEMRKFRQWLRQFGGC